MNADTEGMRVARLLNETSASLSTHPALAALNVQVVKVVAYGDNPYYTVEGVRPLTGRPVKFKHSLR